MAAFGEEQNHHYWNAGNSEQGQKVRDIDYGGTGD
jgi:hypothetical protein